MRAAGLLLAVALIGALPACMAVRTREFSSDRAGAQAAIGVLLRQPQNGSIQFTLKKEPVETPQAIWKDDREIHPAEPVTGVVVLRFDAAGAPLQESRTFAGNRQGLAEAQAFVGEGRSLNRLIVRVDRTRGGWSDEYAWGWIAMDPGAVAVFDDGVCLRDDCVDYSTIRAVWATNAEQQSGPYPATRDGLMAAIADPVAHETLGNVAVEAQRPVARVWKPVRLYAVSVLEDERICGEAAEFPLAMMERCYAYSQIEGLRVVDSTTTLADAVSDTVTFPFRLVGAAATATAMSAH